MQFCYCIVYAVLVGFSSNKFHVLINVNLGDVHNSNYLLFNAALVFDQLKHLPVPLDSQLPMSPVALHDMVGKNILIDSGSSCQHNSQQGRLVPPTNQVI